MLENLELGKPLHVVAGTAFQNAIDAVGTHDYLALGAENHYGLPVFASVLHQDLQGKEAVRMRSVLQRRRRVRFCSLESAPGLRTVPLRAQGVYRRV